MASQFGDRKPRHFQPDDRHAITDPYANPAQWAGSVIKGRVAELFLTSGGLPGHTTQIQQEIKRLVSSKNVKGLEGLGGDQVMPYLQAINEVKSALVSAGKAATFDFPKFKLEFDNLGSDMYLERRGGQLYRDGKPA